MGSRGGEITATWLAKRLRPFKIRPGDVRVPRTDKHGKGYDLRDFQDAFERYLPEQTVTSGQSTLSKLPVPEFPRSRAGSRG